MTVKLSGTLRIPMAQQSKMLPLMDDHIRATRDEAGNISFVISKDAHDPEIFHVSEEFVDQSAFDFHQKRGAASAWGIASKELVRDFKISSK